MCLLFHSIDWASVVALATAIATILMVIEMKRQREQSSMPDIFLKSEARFYLYRSYRMGGNYYSHWHDSRRTEQNEIDSVPPFTYGISAVNIGWGNAKYLKCTYSIDEKAIVSFINELGVVNISKLDLEGKGISYEGTIYQDVLGGNSANDLYVEYDFILQNAKESIRIMLPKIYLHLFSAFIFSTAEPSKAAYRNDFPPLYLKIACIDIKGKEYRKEFSISLFYDSVSPSSPSANVSGLIRVKEIRVS